jgi:hypothetical protein
MQANNPSVEAARLTLWCESHWAEKKSRGGIGRGGWWVADGADGAWARSPPNSRSPRGENLAGYPHGSPAAGGGEGDLFS